MISAEPAVPPDRPEIGLPMNFVLCIEEFNAYGKDV